jgi:hypothetical protein
LTCVEAGSRRKLELPEARLALAMEVEITPEVPVEEIARGPASINILSVVILPVHKMLTRAGGDFILQRAPKKGMRNLMRILQGRLATSISHANVSYRPTRPRSWAAGSMHVNENGVDTSRCFSMVREDIGSGTSLFDAR